MGALLEVQGFEARSWQQEGQQLMLGEVGELLHWASTLEPGLVGGEGGSYEPRADRRPSH